MQQLHLFVGHTEGTPKHPIRCLPDAAGQGYGISRAPARRRLAWMMPGMFGVTKRVDLS